MSAYTSLSVSVSVPMSMYVCVRVCVYVHAHKCALVCVCLCMFACTYWGVFMVSAQIVYIHTFTLQIKRENIYMHIYMYIYTCIHIEDLYCKIFLVNLEREKVCSANQGREHICMFCKSRERTYIYIYVHIYMYMILNIYTVKHLHHIMREKKKREKEYKKTLAVNSQHSGSQHVPQLFEMRIY